LAELHGQQWEHRRVLDPDEETLTAIGNDGWELVAIDPRDGAHVFKRPRISFRERVTRDQTARVYASRARQREAEA
jgi:hypothetical protein